MGIEIDETGEYRYVCNGCGTALGPAEEPFYNYAVHCSECAEKLIEAEGGRHGE